MQLPQVPKPEWLKVRLPGGEPYSRVRDALRSLDLHTVCEEARCPNVAECWGGGTATIMLLGDVCTRGCRFCHVRSGNPGGAADPEEPHRVAEAVLRLGMRYVVLTSVDRDDLPDGGADHFARTIERIKQDGDGPLVEALIPDFRGDRAALARVLAAGPDVLAHNVETVERLTPLVRDARAGYAQSLGLLRAARASGGAVFTKSSLMLGLGETDAEVETALADLRAAGVAIVTLGQYLRPSPWHLPVREYVHPDRFAAWERRARELGFLYGAAGPLVRSSYRAGEYFVAGLLEKRRREAFLPPASGADGPSPAPGARA